MPLDQALAFIAKDNPQTMRGQRWKRICLPTTCISLSIPHALSTGLATMADTGKPVTKIPISIDKQYITNNQLAVLDVIMSNIYDRPVYFSVTCQESKLMNLGDYTQMEGLGLRIIPVKSPSQKEFYIYGSGRVNAEKLHDRVVNKWKWGNFDKQRLYVDNSYGASVQAQR